MPCIIIQNTCNGIPYRYIASTSAVRAVVRLQCWRVLFATFLVGLGQQGMLSIDVFTFTFCLLGFEHQHYRRKYWNKGLTSFFALLCLE